MYRVGDKPSAGLFIFSQQDNEPVALVTKFAGAEMRQTLTLHKGRIIFRWRRTFSNLAC